MHVDSPSAANSEGYFVAVRYLDLNCESLN